MLAKVTRYTVDTMCARVYLDTATYFYLGTLTVRHTLLFNRFVVHIHFLP